MLVSEIIQRVQSLYSKGVQSDDSKLSSRHIYNKILSVRSRLIVQSSKQRQKLSQWYYVTLPCVELTPAQKYECPCLPAIGCTILKSKHALPKPLVNLSQHLIKSVTSLDGQVVYSTSTFEDQKYKKGRKYTSGQPDYWIRDGYLFTEHRKGPKVVSIEILPQDPAEALAYPSFCGVSETSCISPLDLEFAMDNDKIDTLIEFFIFD